MADVGIDVSGLKEALAGLDKLALRAEDQTPVWAEVAPFLQAVADRRFTPGGAPAFWPARKTPATWSPLHKTGALQRSISEVPGKQGVKQRATAPYAWYQQRGSRKRVSITASAAARAIGEGAVTATVKGKRTVVLIDGQWVFVAKRGSFTVDVAGFGRQRAKKVKVAKREQAGRGGIAARPFLFLEPENLKEVQGMLVEFLSDAFPPGEVTQ